MWSDAYSDACAQLKVTPREDLQRFSGDDLDFAGNIYERFENRLKDEDVIAIVRAARACPVSGVMLLPYNNITCVGATSIAEGLRDCLTAIRVLDLSHNSVGDSGAVAVAAALRKNTSLTHLYLSGNPLGGQCGMPFGCTLKENRTLVLLNLYNTEMSMQSLVHICNALEVNKGLVSLNLGKPLLSNPDDINYVVHHLALALKHNTTLQDLCLAHFNITDCHLQMLLPSLCDSNVTQLSLKGNKLSQDAGDMLNKLLERKQDFTALDISANRLRDVGACSVARGVRVHPHLRALCLENNTIGEKGITELAGAVEGCRSLETFTLWGNDFSGDAVASMYAIRDRLELLQHTDFKVHSANGELAIYCT